MVSEKFKSFSNPFLEIVEIPLLTTFWDPKVAMNFGSLAFFGGMDEVQPPGEPSNAAQDTSTLNSSELSQMRQVQPVQSFAKETKTHERMEVRKGRSYIYTYIFFMWHTNNILYIDIMYMIYKLDYVYSSYDMYDIHEYMYKYI